MSLLDQLWELVNAKGGYVSPADIRGQARAALIDEILSDIERLGGKDPAVRRAEQAKQEMHHAA